jgi:glycosyltransferase involved in cell wall biosynthesis
VLIIDANNPVPRDRRVWLQCRALAADGIDVSVICPGPAPLPRYEEIDGIRVHRYSVRMRSGGLLAYLEDYASSLFRTMRLAVHIWRRHRFDVVQACNPPDTFFVVARLFRLLGTRFVFDQHDLSPEIYADRFPSASRVVLRVLTALERMSHRSADHVLTVNESCRQLLLSRNATPPDRLTVVRTGPELDRLRRQPPVEELRHGRNYLCAYLGVMGPQDGVHLVLEAAAELIHRMGREDVQFVLMGDGDRLPYLQRLAAELEIEPWVSFTGFADDDTICRYLSSSDLGLQPDQRTAFTDLCSMVKTIEYMAFGLPVVTFDLKETRRSAADAAFYVPVESAAAYASAIVALLENADLRTVMSTCATRRARDELSWQRQAPIYLGVMRSVIQDSRAQRPLRRAVERVDAREKVTGFVQG